MCFVCQQKLKTDEYPTVQTFMNDFRLLLSNTWAFYGQGSEEYRSALTLERVLLEKLEKLSGRASEGKVLVRRKEEEGGGGIFIDPCGFTVNEACVCSSVHCHHSQLLRVE